MPDVSDYELLKTTEQAEPARRSVVLWIAVVGIIGAALVTLLFVVWHRRPAPTPAPVRAEAPARPAKPLGGDAEAIAVPPLNETDALVRELVSKVTSHPRVAAWLATDDLIRSFTIGVANVA